MSQGPLAAFIALIGFCEFSFASITVTADVLDAGDGGPQPPAGIVIIDVQIDVSADDYWTAAGLRGRTFNGARIRYAFDANDQIVLVNPGLDDRFVTFASQPRPRHGDGRFINGGASPAGAYCPTGSSPLTAGSELNVAWFRIPPTGTDGVDGAIFRLALELPAYCTLGDDYTLVPGVQNPPGRFPLFQADCQFGGEPALATSSADFPTPAGFDFTLLVSGFGPPCVYDFNCDWAIGLGDLTQFLASYGTCRGDPGHVAQTDFDGDRCTDLSDLTRFLAQFGRSYSPYLGCP